MKSYRDQLSFGSESENLRLEDLTLEDPIEMLEQVFLN